MKSTIKPVTNTTVLRSMFIAVAVSSAFPMLGSAQAPSKGAEPAVEENYEIEKYSTLRYGRTIASSAFESDILPPEKIVPEKIEEIPFEMKLVSVTGKDGRYRATVVDKKGKYTVVSDKPGADGYYLADIKPAASIQEVEVKVANAGQHEWVTFDPARFKMAAKGAPKAPANTKGRPRIVPNTRKGPPTRAPIPASKTAKAAGAKAGAEAKAAFSKANAAAVEKAKSRSNGRRVVLPPKNR